ncbi:2-dehydropantoate 2-reductase [Bacillus sp. PS06]|uniref:2-dehydropantoate 2-reductase n=1 Tax=Bacillus sp. PS06 TaxID=2764176 RepID=UPI00177F34D3|nr:2-dehydropantoate 2-reductase [Bacillus sp. PS06]MBD8068402.1 2-dehydropantoate 2-reductase [Bacillus sp. PS06]
MNIGIIGGGAIGLLFGYYLSFKHEVTIYTKSEQQAYALNQAGISLEEDIYTQKVSARPLSAGLSTHQAVIFAVKQYHLEEVLNQIEERIQHIPILLFLQNGMSHLRLLDNLHQENVGIGIVEHGALKLSETRINHTGKGVVKISAYKGRRDFLLSIFEGENVSKLKAIKEDDFLLSMQSKLVINAVINPLTALYKVENGLLLSNSYIINTMKLVFNEVVSVLSIPNPEKQWDMIKQICENTASNRSSMLKDIELGRETEIDSILGYVLEQARLQNKTLAVTDFLYHAIKGLEKRRN